MGLKIRMIPIKKHRYGGQWREPGKSYEARIEDRRILIGAGLAKEAPAPTPSVPRRAEPAAPPRVEAPAPKLESAPPAAAAPADEIKDKAESSEKKRRSERRDIRPIE